jgi:hypothetical protein
MAGNQHNRSPTHTAYAFKREGRKSGRWLEIGIARAETNDRGLVRVFLDRLPIGGFTGGVLLTPFGTEPPEPTGPQRPGPAPPEEIEEFED